MNSHPLIYLRLLYRVPVMAVTMLACYFFARVLGMTGALRVWAATASRVCGREIEVIGAAPDPAARMIVANHVSYLDTIPMYLLWPACRPVAMEKMRRWFLIGPLVRGTAIFVDKDNPVSRQRARDEMRRTWRENRPVVVFPEGRVSYNGRSFKAGAFEEAIAAEVTIQGMRISYSPELIASLAGRRFEERFFWVLCQNFKIQVHVFPAERATGDAARLSLKWQTLILSG